MRIPLPTDLKTRTGAPNKDARQKNSYVETKGEEAIVRKRPSAQGGIPIGTGVAQGGIGLNINGTPYFIGFWADTMQPYTGGGNWTNGANYAAGGSGPDAGVWKNTSVARVPSNNSRNHPIVWNGTYFLYRVYDDQAYKDYIYYSSDLITWNVSDSGVVGYDSSSLAAKTNGQVIAVQDFTSGVFDYSISANGLNYTNTNFSNASDMRDIVLFGSTYLAVGRYDSASSSDGSSWVARSATGTYVTYNGTVLCTVQNFYTASILISTDGINWQTNTLPVSTVAYSISAINGIICISTTDGYILTSSDNGTTWTSTHLNSEPNKVMGGNGLFIVTRSNASTKFYWYSADGINWTQSSFKTSGYWNAGYAGNGVFIAYEPYQNIIATSTSGY